MPYYVIAKTVLTVDQEVGATLCGLNSMGLADRKTDTPVRVRLVNERTLAVDGEARGIVSSVSENGSTVLLVDGTTKGIRNRSRRQQLARASELLNQLAAALKPLTAESEAPGLVTEGLGLLYNWIAEERERATTAPRSADGVSHDDAR